MAQIFISYTRDDRELTEHLARDLQQRGYTVWWDTRLLSGDDIDDVIVRAIDQAEAVIVIWTPNSIRSKWVRFEARRADRAGKLIPVRVQNLAIESVPPPYDGDHIDNIQDREKLYAALAHRGVRSELPAVAPAGPHATVRSQSTESATLPPPPAATTSAHVQRWQTDAANSKLEELLSSCSDIWAHLRGSEPVELEYLEGSVQADAIQDVQKRGRESDRRMREYRQKISEFAHSVQRIRSQHGAGVDELEAFAKANVMIERLRKECARLEQAYGQVDAWLATRDPTLLQQLKRWWLPKARGLHLWYY